MGGKNLILPTASGVTGPGGYSIAGVDTGKLPSGLDADSKETTTGYVGVQLDYIHNPLNYTIGGVVQSPPMVTHLLQPTIQAGVNLGNQVLVEIGLPVNVRLDTSVPALDPNIDIPLDGQPGLPLVAVVGPLRLSAKYYKNNTHNTVGGFVKLSLEGPSFSNDGYSGDRLGTVGVLSGVYVNIGESKRVSLALSGGVKSSVESWFGHQSSFLADKFGALEGFLAVAAQLVLWRKPNTNGAFQTGFSLSQDFSNLIAGLPYNSNTAAHAVLVALVLQQRLTSGTCLNLSFGGRLAIPGMPLSGAPTGFGGSFLMTFYTCKEEQTVPPPIVVVPPVPKPDPKPEPKPVPAPVPAPLPPPEPKPEDTSKVSIVPKDDKPKTPELQDQDIAKTLDKDKKVILPTDYIQFDFDSAKLPDSQKVVDLAVTFVKYLIDHPDIRTLYIDGHTDTIGASAYNQNLAQRRARALADKIIDIIGQKKLDHVVNIAIKSYGESCMLEPDFEKPKQGQPLPETVKEREQLGIDKPQARKNNRRIVVSLDPSSKNKDGYTFLTYENNNIKEQAATANNLLECPAATTSQKDYYMPPKK